jgi:phage terminase small subunit
MQQISFKHKKFCQLWVDGLTPIEAYKQAKLPLDKEGNVPPILLGEVLINPNVTEYIDILKTGNQETFGLSEKRQRFCREYVSNGFNGKLAYKTAGYSAKTDNVAAVEASKLLREPRVIKYIESLKTPVIEKTQIKAEEIINECKIVGFSDIREAVNIIDGEIFIKNLEELPSSVSKCIAELTSTIGKGGTTFKIRLHDKLKALEMLSKFSGLSSDLSEAMAVFRRYGYEVQETDIGYSMIDLYRKE